MATFKERVKDLRLSLNFSIRQLSAVSGISKSALSAYECGSREPSFESLEALSDVFNCDIDYLLGRTDIKNSLLHQLGGYNSLYEAYKAGVDIDNISELNLQLFAQNKSPDENNLTEGEREFLELFRMLPEEEQRIYLEMLRARLNARTKGQAQS
jgi:transcriptional regulator with XRE-family HTH domain